MNAAVEIQRILSEATGANINELAARIPAIMKKAEKNKSVSFRVGAGTENGANVKIVKNKTWKIIVNNKKYSLKDKNIILAKGCPGNKKLEKAMRDRVVEQLTDYELVKEYSPNETIRADLLVSKNNKHIAIEFKSNVNTHTLLNALGQAFAYKTMFKLFIDVKAVIVCLPTLPSEWWINLFHEAGAQVIAEENISKLIKSML